MRDLAKKSPPGAAAAVVSAPAKPSPVELAERTVRAAQAEVSDILETSGRFYDFVREGTNGIVLDVPRGRAALLEAYFGLPDLHEIAAAQERLAKLVRWQIGSPAEISAFFLVMLRAKPAFRLETHAAFLRAVSEEAFRAAEEQKTPGAAVIRGFSVALRATRYLPELIDIVSGMETAAADLRRARQTLRFGAKLVAQIDADLAATDGESGWP